MLEVQSLLRAGRPASAGFYSAELHEEDRRGRLRAPHRRACPPTWRRCSPPRTTSRPSGTSASRRRSRSTPTTPSRRRSTSPTSATADDVEKVYTLAYKSGCKGVTIYRDGSREEQVLNVGQTRKKRDPAAGIATTRPSRPQLLSGETQRMETGCGKLFVIMNDDEYGPREVFANMGKAGGCASSNTEALGRLISLALKKGASAAEIVDQLKGIRCHVPYGSGPTRPCRAPTPSARRSSAATCTARPPSGAPRPSRSSRWSRSPRAPAPIAAARSSTRAAASSAGSAATPSAGDPAAVSVAIIGLPRTMWLRPQRRRPATRHGDPRRRSPVRLRRPAIVARRRRALPARRPMAAALFRRAGRCG